MKIVVFFVSMLALVSPVSAEQVCSDRMRSSAVDAERFAVLPDGTVEDIQTNLLWQRCPVGYQVDEGATDTIWDDTCVAADKNRFRWQEAFDAAATLNPGGDVNGWRLPNIKELNSIVERRCIGPSLRNGIFPATDWTVFWSSTTYTNLLEAAVLDFSIGINAQARKNPEGNSHALRLVRNFN